MLTYISISTYKYNKRRQIFDTRKHRHKENRNRKRFSLPFRTIRKPLAEQRQLYIQTCLLAACVTKTAVCLACRHEMRNGGKFYGAAGGYKNKSISINVRSLREWYIFPSSYCTEFSEKIDGILLLLCSSTVYLSRRYEAA